jgi:aldose 1-epimerase
LQQLFKAHGDLYLLREPGAAPPPAPTLAARVVEPRSGRVLEAYTDEFCLQVYTGAALDGTQVGKFGRGYGPFAGLCLECEGYADGTNLPEFGDILVHPGQPQRRNTRYAFSTV